MKYTKPEIIVLDRPIDVIQTTSKKGLSTDQPNDQPTGSSAYEADE